MKLFRKKLLHNIPGRTSAKRWPQPNMLRSKGFTMIEVMIVVAIIGILATVCIPLYMSYIQKSRLRTLVYPGLHIIESNITLYYASQGMLPDESLLPEMMLEADTTYFNVSITSGELVITIDSFSPESKLSRLHDKTMYLKPDLRNNKITTWALRGSLARYLGINTGAM